MASAWDKVRYTVFTKSELNGLLHNDSQKFHKWGRAWQGALPKRVENLNPLVPGRSGGSKSAIRPGSETSIQPSIKLDYSETYRENEVLEGDLEEHLDGLKRLEKRQLLEKGEQLKEIRKQVEVITRLQEAVNARKPGQSAGLVVSRSSRGSIQYGQSFSRRKSRLASTEDTGDSRVPDVDFAALAQATKTQMRVAAEREKYSAKNLFNVRRPKTALGHYSSSDKSAAPQTRFFAGPPVSSTIEDRDISGAVHTRGSSEKTDSSFMNAYKNSRPSSARNGFNQNGHNNGDHSETTNNDIFFHKTNLPLGGYDKRTGPKGNSRLTTASRGEGPLGVNSDTQCNSDAHIGYSKTNRAGRAARPKTAVGFINHHREDVDDLLPPRAKSAVMRSRSRRELELLCRAMDPEVEEAAAAAAAIVSGDAKEWEIVNEKRRRRKLKQLQQESQQLNIRVQRFLSDIDGFNKRRSTAKRRPSSALVATVAVFEEDF